MMRERGRNRERERGEEIKRENRDHGERVGKYKEGAGSFAEERKRRSNEKHRGGFR